MFVLEKLLSCSMTIVEHDLQIVEHNLWFIYGNCTI